jgi:hypothetical protein
VAAGAGGRRQRACGAVDQRGLIGAEAADARAPLLCISPLRQKKSAIDVLYQAILISLVGAGEAKNSSIFAKNALSLLSCSVFLAPHVCSSTSVNSLVHLASKP